MIISEKFKLCNRILGCTLVLTLASGIQLEVTSGRYACSVWVHIILGILLTGISFYHIYLHYKTGKWFSRFAKNRNTVTRILWWTFLFTVISGVAATVHWIAGGHSPIGGVHGKIGFLMVLVAGFHVAKHLRKKTGRL